MDLPEGRASIKHLLDAIARHEVNSYEAQPVPGSEEPPSFICKKCSAPVRQKTHSFRVHGTRSTGRLFWRSQESYDYYKVVHVPYCAACEGEPRKPELELHE